MYRVFWSLFLSVLPESGFRSFVPEAAQVSWRCAGRRPSVLLYGMFFRSEAGWRWVSVVVFFCIKQTSSMQSHPRFNASPRHPTCDDVLQDAVFPLTNLRFHLPFLQLSYQVHLWHLRHHRALESHFFSIKFCIKLQILSKTAPVKEIPLFLQG